jgi:hypothetical protein
MSDGLNPMRAAGGRSESRAKRSASSCRVPDHELAGAAIQPSKQECEVLCRARQGQAGPCRPSGKAMAGQVRGDNRVARSENGHQIRPGMS